MAQHLPSSNHAIPFLISITLLLLFYSCPSSGYRVQQKTTGNEWHQQKLEQLEAIDSMRMTGSDVTKANQYPYMVALAEYDPETEEYSGVFCGGSLISPTHVLTAAHCVIHDDSEDDSELRTLNRRVYETDQLIVLLGVHFINRTHNDAQSFKNVRRIKIHEKYDPDNSYNNDIAILTLDSAVKYTKIVKPVCLPPQGSNDQYVGQMAIVKGWGHTEEDGNASQVLLHAEKAIISNSQCQEIYEDDKITTRMMCAYRAGKDTCQGDSGGPVVIESNDLDENNTIETETGNRKKDCKWIQVGIVSWGTGCARKGIPGVYARVTSFLPWIKKEMTSKNQGVRNSDSNLLLFIISFSFFPLLFLFLILVCIKRNILIKRRICRRIKMNMRSETNTFLV